MDTPAKDSSGPNTNSEDELSIEATSSTTFAKPFQVGSINAIEVTHAREMVRLHTAGRQPVGRQPQPVRGDNSVKGPIANSRVSAVGGIAINRTPMANSKASPVSSTKSTTMSKTTIAQSSTPSTSKLSASSNKSSASFPSAKSPTHTPVGATASKMPQVSVPAKSHQGECTNPQCVHCGQVIIPSPQAAFPISEEPSISVNEWSVFSVKRPILNSPEIDALNDTRFDFPLPEMIFGNSVMRVVHEPSGRSIEFNAVDALESLDAESDLKVSYHQEWLEARKKKKEVKKDLDVLKPYDWTYLPHYKGTSTFDFEPTENDAIPIDRLLQPDPIMFFDEAVLYEDELGDNGIAILLTKIRVMPTCLLLLCRFFLRIDAVIFRIRDVRIFVDFDTNDLIREYKTQEMAYDDVVKLVTGKADPKKLFRDANWVSGNIPVIEVTTEKAHP